MSSIGKNKIVMAFLVFSFFLGYCSIANAELVTHPGLPNQEGVKPNPLDPRLENPELPNRKGAKLGELIAHAAFTAQTQLDTNVFLENEGEDFDVITTLDTSVGLELPVQDNNFSIDYNFTPNIFAINNKHNYIDHRVRGVALFSLTDYKITFVDVYRYFSDRSGSEDVNRVKRQNNFFRSGIAATQFDQLAFDLGYTLGVENFIDNNTLYTSPNGDITYHDKDRLLNVFDATVSYRIAPKTTLLLESYLGYINYDSPKSSDSWYTETMLGVRGKLTEKLTADFKAGIRYQQYSSSDLTDDSNFIGPVCTGTIAYKRNDKDVFSLRLERSIFESTFNNMNYYNVNHAGLDYTHFFNDKLSFNLFGFYQLNLYPSNATVDGVNKKRFDHLFGGGSGLRYDMQEWMSLKFGYEYRQKKSNFGTFNYNDNLITFTGSVGF